MNKKTIVVALVLLIGFFMTYLSRLPLASTRGAEWIWSYIPAGDAQACFLFNLFHLGSLLPLFLFGFFYVRGQVKWTFHFAALVHFIITFFLYYNYEPRRAEDVINFIMFPVLTAFAAFAAGAIVFLLERKTAAAIGSRR